MKTHIQIIAVLHSLVFCLGLAAAQEPDTSLSLPAGTAIPVSFGHTLDASKLKVGDPIVVKTDQRILLAGGQRIPRGAKLVGSVVEVQTLISAGSPSELAIKFDTLQARDRSFPVHVALRALASFVDSYSTRSPVVDNGYPNDSVYRQVGGDYFYPNDTVYSNEWDEVGKANEYGVFVKLRSVQLSSSVNHVSCEGTNTLQSVGVFASSACGVYGFVDLTVNASGADSSRVIRFRSIKHAVKIASGSSALLQETSRAEQLSFSKSSR
jgi:hypothetical protein